MSTGGKYYVTLPSEGFDPRIVDLVYERPRCVLFLSETNLIASATFYDTIWPEKDASEQVKALTKKLVEQ